MLIFAIKNTDQAFTGNYVTFTDLNVMPSCCTSESAGIDPAAT